MATIAIHRDAHRLAFACTDKVSSLIRSNTLKEFFFNYGNLAQFSFKNFIAVKVQKIIDT